MRFVFLLSIFFFSAHQFVSAQDEPTDHEAYDDSAYNIEDEGETTHVLMAPEELATTQAYQNDRLSIKKFDDGKWKQIVGQVNFNEEEEVEKKKEKKSTSDDSGFSVPWGGPLVRAISYLVIIAVVLAVIYFLVRNISAELKIQRTQTSDEDFGKPVENIETVDIESALEKAVREGNFKLAVRLYYLDLLKKLNERGLISWKKDKTNRDYLAELFSRNVYFDEIRRLTLSYESVWYGEHGIKAETFHALRARFQDIVRNLNPGERS